MRESLIVDVFGFDSMPPLQGLAPELYHQCLLHFVALPICHSDAQYVGLLLVLDVALQVC